MFHKILSNEQYGIGSVLMKSLKNYQNSYSDVEAAIKQMPLPMKSAVNIVKEIV